MLCRLLQSRRSFGAVAACVAAAALTACASSGGAGGEGGSGGTGGTGGTTTGGSTGGGGAGGSGAGSGGGTSTGGVTGTGGVKNTGGAPGTGGTTGSGGLSGSGGLTGTGGSAGAGGGKGGGTGTGGGGGKTASGGVTGTGGLPGAGGAAGHAGAGGAGGSGNAGNSGTAGASTCPAATPPGNGTKVCSNTTGTVAGGYAYELWSNGTGTGCMTVYGVAADFSATWTNAGDFLARIGLGFNEDKTPTQIGTISSDFAETKTGDSGLVYVGIYGWSVNPLREYYIIDDWGSSKPADTASDGTPRTHVGTITVDGDSYDVWKHTQTNKPAITGDNQTFDQYFSVRQTARQCGHISISQHFSQWAGLGMQLGNLEEAKLLVEAQNSTGTIDFTTATVVVK